MKAIVNTKIILEDGIIFNGTVLFDNGMIIDAGESENVDVPQGCEIIDAGGKYTAPGLIDIHCHGAGSNWFYDEPQLCSEFFIKHGVTTILPTFYMNMSLEEMIEGADKIRRESKIGAGRIMNGLYMEGPYMNNEGSFRNEYKWSQDIIPEEYVALVDGMGTMPRVWAIDPELTGIEEFMKYVNKKTPEAIFALGHSSAKSEDCRRVEKYGVKVQTHHSDSGMAKGRAQDLIGAGCDEYTLYNPDMYAELIVDERGIHVDPDRVKLVIRTKGVEKIILISDSTKTVEGYTNDLSAGIHYGPDLNYDDEGRLAGSRLTLDSACRNVMVHTGHGLCHAIRMATINPAKMLGIDDEVGSIEVGKKANLIIIDDMVNVEKVFLEGELLVENK